MVALIIGTSCFAIVCVAILVTCVNYQRKYLL